MTARRPAENAEFMLHANHVHVRDVQEISRAQVGRQILLRNLEAHLRRVIVTAARLLTGTTRHCIAGNSVAMAQRESVVNVAMPHFLGR